MNSIKQKIPEGWCVKKLGDCCSFMGGGTPSRATLDFFNGSIPWVKTTDLNNSLLYKTEENISELGLNNSSCKIISKGAVCVAMYGGFNQIGRTCLLGMNAAVNQAITAIIPSHILSNKYLLTYLNFNVHQWKKFASSSRKDPNITKQDITFFQILLPPLSEQEKIARILSCWDDGIEKLSALIEKKKIQKKALMQQLLTGKTRLPGFIQPWKNVKLGDIGIISSAGVDKKIVEGEKLVNLLNYMDVYRKDFLYASGTSMTVSAPERQIRNCNLKKGDIFFTPSSETRDDIAHSAVVMEDIANGVYSYHIVRLRPMTSIDLKFSAYAFKTNHFYKQAFSICEGSGQRYVISQDDFRNMTVFIPSDIVEQKTIAEILSKADEEIELLNKKLEAFKQEKKALMQQLLTGKIRVKVN